MSVEDVDVRQIEAGEAPTRFARGWHCLGLTKDLGDGKPHSIKAFGQKLVVFRGADGRLNVLDRPGGAGIALTGHHELLIPLLHAAVVASLPRRG